MKNLNKSVKAVTCVVAVFIALSVIAGTVMAVKQTGSDKDIQPQEAALFENGIKAMWISYLEFQSVDFSTQDSFTANMDKIFTDCADMGLDTVIVQVRPFGDALYKSDIFPASHLMTGTQGQDVGYDPLEIMTKLAHSKNLRIEGWRNPYRVQLHSNMRPCHRGKRWHILQSCPCRGAGYGGGRCCGDSGKL